MVGNRELGAILREMTKLTEADLERALQVQQGSREPLGQILVQMGLISERDRVRALGRQWGIKFLELNRDDLDEEIINLIPRHLIQRYRVLPVEREGNRLTVVMMNPLDIFTIDQLRLVTGMEIDPAITTEDDLSNTIAALLTSADHIDATIRRVVDEVGSDDDIKLVEGKKEDDISLDQLRELVDDAPIIQLVNMVIP